MLGAGGVKEPVRYFLLALCLRIAWAAAIPDLYAPDEGQHLTSVHFFTERLRLATPEEIHSGVHPFYIASSPLPYLPFVLIDRAALATTGALAPLFALRLASTVCGALLVLLSVFFSRRLFGAHPLRHAVPLALALLPQLVFVSASVSWDPLSILAAAAIITTWPALLLDRLDAKLAALAGGLAGLVLLVKPTSFCVLPVHALVFLSAALRARDRASIPIAVLTCALVGGPFMVHNWRLFPGDPLAISPIIHTTSESWRAGVPAPANLLFETRWVINSFESTWALFGFMNLKVPNFAYVLIALSCIAALVGLARTKPTSAQQRIAIAGLAAIVMAIVISYWTNIANDYQPQGRYFFAAILPMIAFWVQGLANLHKRAITVSLALLALLHVYSLYLVSVSPYQSG
jgi:hypothetical protein